MKKIDKSKILSKKYFKWMQELKENHPKYSSSHKYIVDIKMNLLYCQNGLCAYTEELLCDLTLLKEDFELDLELKKPYEYITSWQMTLNNLEEQNA